jgi:sorting nexin-29
LRQGNVVAPLLFNVVLETAIRSSKVQTRGTIFDKSGQIMANADDVVITGRLQSIKYVFILLLEQKNKTGLEVSKKARFMIVSRKPYCEN